MNFAEMYGIQKHIHILIPFELFFAKTEQLKVKIFSLGFKKSTGAQED